MDFGILPVDVAAEDGKPGRFLLGGLAVETWGLKVTLRVTLGMGRGLFALSRSSSGDVSDMAGRVCDYGRERSLAEVVGREEKRDERRDGLARLNFGSCAGEGIEGGAFVSVYSTGDCSVILQYITREAVVYGRCWRCLTTRAGAWLAGSLRSEFEQIKLSRPCTSVMTFGGNGASSLSACACSTLQLEGILHNLYTCISITVFTDKL